MNILFLYKYNIDPVRGGIEKVSMVLANYFMERGCYVKFLAKERHSEFVSAMQLLLPEAHNLLAKDNEIFFYEILDKYKIDIVINQSGLDPIISGMAYLAKKRGLKLISVLHSSPLTSIKNFGASFERRAAKMGFVDFFDLFGKSNLFKRILMCSYRMKYYAHFVDLLEASDRVVLLSNQHKSELGIVVPTYVAKNEKVISIPNPSPYEPIISSKKKKRVLFVGRINTTSKRVDLLLQIWKCVYPKFSEWTLDIVGGGEEFDYIKNMADDLALKNVVFHGFQSPETFYSEAAILCLTSSYEGFGMVLVEGMSFGLVPVVFNSFSAVSDIIDDNVNGCLIQPFDVIAFSEKLMELMSLDDLRENFSANAVIKARQFNLECVGKRWIALMDEVVKVGVCNKVMLNVS